MMGSNRSQFAPKDDDHSLGADAIRRMMPLFVQAGDEIEADEFGKAAETLRTIARLLDVAEDQYGPARDGQRIADRALQAMREKF